MFWMLGAGPASCPGRAFSPQGDPGAEAPREVFTAEPRHTSQLGALPGPAWPLRNCRLWATVRIKWVTTHVYGSPTLAVPAPTLWGPSLWGPLQVCQRHRGPPPHVLTPGVGAGRSKRKVLLVGAPLLEGCPFPGALHWLPAPQLRAGWGLASLPASWYTPPWPSWLPLCLSGPSASGARGLGRGQGATHPRGHHLKATSSASSHLLLHLRGAAPPWLGPCRGDSHSLGWRQVSPGPLCPSGRCCCSCPTASCALARQVAVPNSGGGGLASTPGGAAAVILFSSLCSRCSKAMFSKAWISLAPPQFSKRRQVYTLPPIPPQPHRQRRAWGQGWASGGLPHLARRLLEPQAGQLRLTPRRRNPAPPGVPGRPSPARPLGCSPRQSVGLWACSALFPAPHWPVSGAAFAVHTDQSGGGRPGRHRLSRKGQGLCGSQEGPAPRPAGPAARQRPWRASLGPGPLAPPPCPPSPAALRWRSFPQLSFQG